MKEVAGKFKKKSKGDASEYNIYIICGTLHCIL